MRRQLVGGVNAEVAETFFERARGLIGHAPLASGEGLWIPHCNCVHTCFMRFAIDVTFFDRRGEKVKVVRNVRPWRLWVWGGWRAASVLETGCEFE